MAERPPAATISRLITYLRVVTQLKSAGALKTSSDELAGEAQISAFQIRKDLAYFGTFGTRGSGYDVTTLIVKLREILGLQDSYGVAIIGMGRLGQALTDYPALLEYDFQLQAYFDRDPAKIGKTFGGIEVFPMERLAETVQQRPVEMVFITVPAAAAQEVADAAISAGVYGILNFAPTVLTVPEGVSVESVDFLAGLKRLSYRLRGRQAVR
jgi:redox-sensing transcriptional repressor